MNSDKDKETRKRENAALLEKMKSGESLSRVSVQSTWFPPRPPIKKDLKEQARLYGSPVGLSSVKCRNGRLTDHSGHDLGHCLECEGTGCP